MKTSGVIDINIILKVTGNQQVKRWECCCQYAWQQILDCLTLQWPSPCASVSQSAVAQCTPCCCSDHQMFGCIIHSDGCFCIKISALFVNGSDFTAPWSGRMAASKQNNNCFTKPAKSFQMVAKPQPRCGYLNQSSYLNFYLIMQQLSNRCTSWCVQQPFSKLCI